VAEEVADGDVVSESAVANGGEESGDVEEVDDSTTDS